MSLRERLKPLCKRALRKQVSEYVQFTRRIPITQDFFPSAGEQRLKDKGPEYLRREELMALPASHFTDSQAGPINAREGHEATSFLRAPPIALFLHERGARGNRRVRNRA